MVRVKKNSIVEYEATSECIYCHKKFNVRTREELEKLVNLHYKYVHKTKDTMRHINFHNRGRNTDTIDDISIS